MSNIFRVLEAVPELCEGLRSLNGRGINEYFNRKSRNLIKNKVIRRVIFGGKNKDTINSYLTKGVFVWLFSNDYNIKPSSYNEKEYYSSGYFNNIKLMLRIFYSQGSFKYNLIHPDLFSFNNGIHEIAKGKLLDLINQELNSQNGDILSRYSVDFFTEFYSNGKNPQVVIIQTKGKDISYNLSDEIEEYKIEIEVISSIVKNIYDKYISATNKKRSRFKSIKKGFENNIRGIERKMELL